MILLNHDYSLSNCSPFMTYLIAYLWLHTLKYKLNFVHRCQRDCSWNWVTQSGRCFGRSVPFVSKHQQISNTWAVLPAEHGTEVALITYHEQKFKKNKTHSLSWVMYYSTRNKNKMINLLAPSTMHKIWQHYHNSSFWF